MTHRVMSTLKPPVYQLMKSLKKQDSQQITQIEMERGFSIVEKCVLVKGFLINKKYMMSYLIIEEIDMQDQWRNKKHFQILNLTQQKALLEREISQEVQKEVVKTVSMNFLWTLSIIKDKEEHSAYLTEKNLKALQKRTTSSDKIK